MARKAQKLRPVMTRIPETLRRRLERLAARNGRSMNSEIIHRLQRTIAIDDSGAATNLLEFLRSPGVEVTEANERDVAVALHNTFGRWAPFAGGVAGEAKSSPQAAESGERLPDKAEQSEVRKSEKAPPLGLLRKKPPEEE
jgi:hypothetical protein